MAVAASLVVALGGKHLVGGKWTMYGCGSGVEKIVVPEKAAAGKWTRIENPVVDERALSKAAAEIDPANTPRRIAWVLNHHKTMVNAGTRFWRSPEYLVAIVDAGVVWPPEQQGRTPDLWWLRIYRHDGQRIRHHWSELQRIKNELVGPEHQGVEIYPPESLLQDGENSYHLWVFKNAASRLPFGLPWPRAWGADGQRTIPTRFIVEGPK
jgi:hypothetical protein